jgi:Tol biopolymer transport system component
MQRHARAAGLRALAGLFVLLSSTGCAVLSRASDARSAFTGDPGVAGRTALSADGRYAAYAVGADAGLPGHASMVVRRDNAEQTIQRVDVLADGTRADMRSTEPAISADGRYVAFTSSAENLVPNDENTFDDVFVRDMVSGTIERVSVASDGTEADLDSYAPSISADGRFVAFTSDSDLLQPDDENSSSDIFVRDRIAHVTSLVSVGPDGTPTDYGAWDGVISGDGLHVAFTTDTDWALTDENSSEDVYVRDIALSHTRRITVTTTQMDGGGSPSLSFDGHVTAFIADSGDVYVRDVGGGGLLRVNLGTTATALGDSPALSADGRFVAWTSAGNASGTDTNGTKFDIFIRDRLNNVTTIGSTQNSLTQLPVDSFAPAISADGAYLAWTSRGAFDAADTNGINDVYVRALAVPTISSVTPAVVTRGTTTSLTVRGRGFATTVMALVGSPGSGIVVNGATRISDGQVVLAVTIPPSAPVGGHPIGILNGGTGLGLLAGAAARCDACLTVT